MSEPRPEVLRCISSRELHLILMPTEACNFRCVYCYESFQLKRMAPHVIEGIQRLLARRVGALDLLTLSWFGGEPLLARDIMERILGRVRELRSRHPDLQFASDATTNGFLLSRTVFERLLELGVNSYQISFDGPREWHDRKRVRAGGGPTYDRIWGNLLELRAVPGTFTIMVRVHADRGNIDALPRFLDEYENAFASDARFELFVRALSRLGGSNDSNLQVFDPQEGRRIIGSLRDEVRRRGLKQTDPGADGGICYAARGNSFLVRADGRINKCTVALEHPNNQVGRLRVDGTVELLQPKLRMWMRGLSSDNRQELQCPMRGYADVSPSLHLATAGQTTG